MENTLLQVIYELENELGHALSTPHPDRYDLIPLRNERFLAGLDFIIKCTKEPVQMIDVGCGVGAKCLLAKHYNEQLTCEGIEINPKYAEVAKKFTHCYQIDALEFNHYHQYNAIYWYTPFSNYKLQLELEEKIIQEAADETLLFPGSLYTYEKFTHEIKHINSTREKLNLEPLNVSMIQAGKDSLGTELNFIAKTNKLKPGLYKANIELKKFDTRQKMT